MQPNTTVALPICDGQEPRDEPRHLPLRDLTTQPKRLNGGSEGVLSPSRNEVVPHPIVSMGLLTHPCQLLRPSGQPDIPCHLAAMTQTMLRQKPDNVSDQLEPKIQRRWRPKHNTQNAQVSIKSCSSYQAPRWFQREQNITPNKCRHPGRDGTHYVDQAGHQQSTSPGSFQASCQPTIETDGKKGKSREGNRRHKENIHGSFRRK